MTNEELQAHITAIKDAISRGEIEWDGPQYSGTRRFGPCSGIFGPYNYRCKSKPREFWIHKAHIDALRREPSGTKAWIFNEGNPSEYVLVREVVE